MLSDKQLRRLNEILAQELGRTPSGEGLYSWAWSESLQHRMLRIDRATSQPVFDYRCACGTNVLIHQAHCRMTVAVPCYVERKMAPELKEQWVAVVWSAPGTREEWMREFGNRLEYPPRGYRVPTNACLEPNVDPDVSVTWDLVHKIRAQRKKTFAQWMEETDDALALKERRDESLLDSMISDAITAFGNAKPGARSGGISLPSTETSATGQEAGRTA